ncbi:nucleoside recognition domain-containing protein [Desulfobacterales bacterium HSG2]|nr:nucleoside recognition domain-containing protein [Desulfobacterales bacterium HSG2]
MTSFQSKVKSGLLSGIQKGWGGFVWIMKILVPISFFTMLLTYSGWMSRIDFLLEPVMGFIGLPSIAALPLIAGILTGIYGGVAAMIMLPLSMDHKILIAVFLLISHNIIQESIVQGKSGFNPLKAAIFRLITSVAAVAILARFIGSEATVTVTEGVSLSNAAPFMLTLKIWCMETLRLSVKIFVIIMTLMMVLGLMKSFDAIHHIVRPLTPVLKIMGLNRRVGILWLTANIFGISYGAAVIVEEAKEGNLTDEELTKLHLSIGINHAMIEDPALFLPLGISPIWLWIPRIVTAIAAVHLFSLWRWITRQSGANDTQQLSPIFTRRRAGRRTIRFDDTA